MNQRRTNYFNIYSQNLPVNFQFFSNASDLNQTRETIYMDNNERQLIQLRQQRSIFCQMIKEMKSDFGNLKRVSNEEMLLSKIDNSFNNIQKLLQTNPLQRQRTFVWKIEDFVIIKQIGKGTFGSVFFAIQKRTKFKLAIKIVQKQAIKKNGLINQFVRQLKIQSKLKHPNIIQIFGFFADKTHFFILMQLALQGSLHTFKNKFTYQGTSFVALSLLLATQYMHKNNIMHRDIKPQNIVISFGQLKICDFGCATFKNNSQDLKITLCGTPLYASPQMLKKQRYNQKVDVWAIGIIVYECLFGKIPFNVKNYQDLKKIIQDQVQFSQTESVPQKFKRFITCCLKKIPQERLDAQRLLKQAFPSYGFQTCPELAEGPLLI